jgi:hypothetical protein
MYCGAHRGAGGDDAFGVEGILDRHRHAVQGADELTARCFRIERLASVRARSQQFMTTAFSMSFTAICRSMYAFTASSAETCFALMAAASFVADM